MPGRKMTSFHFLQATLTRWPTPIPIVKGFWRVNQATAVVAERKTFLIVLKLRELQLAFRFAAGMK
jgi:hypothetical protein